MSTGPRFAIYVVPHPSSELGRIGHGLLAADAAATLGIDPDWYRDRSRDARRYGFHGTLKAPFHLDGSREELEDALAALAARHAPIRDLPLTLSELHGFLALRPSTPSAALASLAASCVRDLDRFRLPASEAELEKRRAKGLSPRQDENLRRWGYPYVLDEFRFHLTLSDRMQDGERAQLKRLLASAFDACRLDVIDLALCIEETPGAQLVPVRRFVLGGDQL